MKITKTDAIVYGGGTSLVLCLLFAAYFVVAGLNKWAKKPCDKTNYDTTLINHSEIPNDNLMETTQKTVNGKQVECREPVIDFTIYKALSTSVNYYGIDKANNRIFVQFSSGKSYIYNNVDHALIANIMAADSIGKYVSANLAGKIQFEKFEYPLVTEPVQDGLDAPIIVPDQPL